MSFFQQLKQIFTEEQTAEPIEEHPLLARIVVLLEAAAYDDDFAEEERDWIRRILVEKYDIPEDEIDALFELAQEKRERNPDIQAVTREINETMAPAEKVELMTEVWQVIFADNRVDAFEEHFARKLQKLLRLDHQAWIRAKLAARKTSGCEPPSSLEGGAVGIQND